MNKGGGEDTTDNSVTIAIDKISPQVVIIAHQATNLINEMPEPQDNRNILYGVNFIISEIKTVSDYCSEVKKLKLDLEEFPSF